MKDYFIRRKLTKPADYEEAYWGMIVDADGNVRNWIKEQEKHLEDFKQELTFLNKLPPGRCLNIC